jgi:hypothetical protein
MAKAPAVKWTREHTLIALNLYCKLPFGQFHHSNPIIVEVAAKMGRNANSLAMKLCNLASLDPVQRARGIKGLEGASQQDRDMWKEFRDNPSVLGPKSEQELHDLFTHDETKELDFLARDKVRLIAPSGPTEIQTTVKARRGQQFFRQAVLNAYDVRCCISGINVPDLLIASHIKPWGKFPNDRLNPRNGLCLSKLHDAAFDGGLITLDKKLSVILSKRLKSFFPLVPEVVGQGVFVRDIRFEDGFEFRPLRREFREFKIARLPEADEKDALGGNPVLTLRSKRRAAEDFAHRIKQRAHHFPRLRRRRAVGRHQDNDVPDGPRQNTAPRHRLANPDAGLFPQCKRFARPPVPHQFDPDDQSHLPDVADIGQRPQAF